MTPNLRGGGRKRFQRSVMPIVSSRRAWFPLTAVLKRGGVVIEVQSIYSPGGRLNSANTHVVNKVKFEN